MGGKFSKDGKNKFEETSWNNFKAQSERSKSERHEMEGKFASMISKNQEQKPYKRKRTIIKESTKGSFLETLKEDNADREIPYKRNNHKIGKTESWEKFHKKHPGTQNSHYR